MKSPYRRARFMIPESLREIFAALVFVPFMLAAIVVVAILLHELPSKATCAERAIDANGSLARCR